MSSLRERLEAMNTEIHPKWLEPFDPDAWMRKKAWVSEKEGKKVLDERTCEECNTVYQPARPSQETCGSRDCLRQREYRLRRRIAAMEKERRKA